MGKTSSRVIIGTLAAGVLVAIGVLAIETRTNGDVEAGSAAPPAASAVDRSRAPAAITTSSSTVMPGSIPRTEVGELAPGEVPIAPPRFDNASDRDRYRAWWIAELGRRAEIYKRLESRPDYPSAAETRALLEHLYDASEPRRRDESADSAKRRNAERRAILSEFLVRFHTTPKTIESRGGDPQFGTPAPPPVMPPLVAQGSATGAPSPVALPDHPPGR